MREKRRNMSKNPWRKEQAVMIFTLYRNHFDTCIFFLFFSVLFMTHVVLLHLLSCCAVFSFTWSSQVFVMFFVYFFHLQFHFSHFVWINCSVIILAKVFEWLRFCEELGRVAQRVDWASVRSENDSFLSVFWCFWLAFAGVGVSVKVSLHHTEGLKVTWLCNHFISFQIIQEAATWAADRFYQNRKLCDTFSFRTEKDEF